MAEDFSGQNLRGRSFKGQDLTGANFSYADIRGADFTNAILRNANFSYAKAGLKRFWAISLLIVSFILSAILGFSLSFRVNVRLYGIDYKIIAVGVAGLLLIIIIKGLPVLDATAGALAGLGLYLLCCWLHLRMLIIGEP
jgi:hypothetical protein